MSAPKKIQEEFVYQRSFPTYRPRKPPIMGLSIERIHINRDTDSNLSEYLRIKDKIQVMYENAARSKQKFAIPKLQNLKEKYFPRCCKNGELLDDLYRNGHSHFEYKILELLDTLKSYLDQTIQSPQKILEIKLSES